jgi:hypothetical protein
MQWINLYPTVLDNKNSTLQLSPLQTKVLADNYISNIKEQILLPVSVIIIVTDYAFILFHSRGRKLPSGHSIVYYYMVLFRKNSSRLQFSDFSKRLVISLDMFYYCSLLPALTAAFSQFPNMSALLLRCHSATCDRSEATHFRCLCVSHSVPIVLSSNRSTISAW